MGCAALGGLFLVGLIASLWMNNGKEAATSTSASTSSTGSTTSQPAAVPGSQWSYEQSDDSMSKGKVYEASVSSSNTVEFGFPYAGRQHAMLTLRTHPRWGRSVIFSIEKGQILCHSYQDCNILIRFDDGKPANYAAVGPSDNSTTTAFIRDYSGFVDKMQKAKTVRISANIYQEGAPVFEFDVSHFDPAKYKPTKSR